MNLMQETLAKLPADRDTPAIINQKGDVLTFSQFFDSTAKLSYLLKKQGISKGSKVLLLANLDWPLYCALASCFQLGAIVVLVDPWASSSYIEGALSQVNPDVLILSKRARIFYIKKAIRRIPKKILLDDLVDRKTTERLHEITPVEKDATALITFTSGTTGKPKGFDRSHEFLLSQQEAHEKFFQHQKGETDLTMYPVFVLSNLKSGMTSVLIKGNLRKIDTIKIPELYQQITRYQVDSVSLSPVILEKLVSYCELLKLPLPLKKIFTGGAPVAQTLCQRVSKLNPSLEGTVIYGSTEAEPIALMSMKEISLDMQSVTLGTPLGRVVSDLSYKLLSIEGAVHPYHQGEVGEVTLTGKFVGKKYWNNEEAFKETKWVDENHTIWHKTGDVVIRKDDVLYMIGRRSQSILTKEGHLFPVPIENQINALKGIKRAAYFQHQNNIYLVYSGDKKAKEDIRKYFDQNNLPVEIILKMNEIPMDSRHRSKIDLPTLKRKL